MSIQAASPKFIFHTTFLLITAFTVQAKVSQAQAFEPVCQVSISSGFCKKESPSTGLLVPQVPEPSVYQASNFSTFEIDIAKLIGTDDISMGLLSQY